MTMASTTKNVRLARTPAKHALTQLPAQLATALASVIFLPPAAPASTNTTTLTMIRSCVYPASTRAKPAPT